MKHQFKQSSELVQLLACSNPDEAVRMRKTHALHQKQMEMIGQGRILAMKALLPDDVKIMLDKIGGAYSRHPNWPHS